MKKEIRKLIDEKHTDPKFDPRDCYQLRCSNCQKIREHVPANINDKGKAFGSHFICISCGTNRHYGDSVIDCPDCPGQVKDELRTLLRNNYLEREGKAKGRLHV